MITLNLRASATRALPAESVPPVRPLDAIEQDAARLFEELRALLGQVRQRTVYMSADTLMHSIEALMPAERMGVMAGVQAGDRYWLGTVRDVTGHANSVHVRADAAKLARALRSFDRTGGEMAGWIHSHPGRGPGATTPSAIDRAQYADWTRHYGRHLLGLIVVIDGYLRFWGDAVEQGHVRVEITGAGIEPVGRGEDHVYRCHI